MGALRSLALADAPRGLAGWLNPIRSANYWLPLGSEDSGYHPAARALCYPDGMYAPWHRFLFLAVAVAVAVPQSASAQKNPGVPSRTHERVHAPVETKSPPLSMVPILVGIDMGWAH